MAKTAKQIIMIKKKTRENQQNKGNVINSKQKAICKYILEFYEGILIMYVHVF